MPPKHLAALILLNLIWGSSYAVAGKAITFFPPLWLYTVRFLLVGLLLLPWCHNFRQIQRSEWKLLWAIATLQAFCFALIALSLRHIDSAVSAIMLKLDVPLTLTLSSLYLREKIQPQLLCGIGCCFLAVFLMNYPLHFYNLPYIGLLLLAPCCSGGANILIKKVQHTDYWQMTALLSFLMAGILAILAILHQEPLSPLATHLTPQLIWLLGYMIIFPSCICYYLFYYVLRHNLLTRVVPFGFLNMVSAIISGALIMQEDITTKKIIGMFLIMLGIYISQLQPKKSSL